METIDVIISLLDTGKLLYKETGETVPQNVLDHPAIMKIVETINQLTGYKRPHVVCDYILGKVNLTNTILRLVVDEPKEPLTPISTSLIPFMARDALKVNKKRGQRKRYNKEMCIEILKEISSQFGPNFSRVDYIRFARQHDGYPNHMTLVKHICGKGRNGTWDEVMREAGLQPRKYAMAK